MKVFEKFEDYCDRLNIIDNNNVFVGFDYSASCCENFGYCFLKDEPHGEFNGGNIESVNFNHSEYIFDIMFFKELRVEKNDEGGAVCFRLVNKSGSGSEIFLVLYNHHNGYYGHGFEMKINGEEKRSGTL